MSELKPNQPLSASTFDAIRKDIAAFVTPGSGMAGWNSSVGFPLTATAVSDSGWIWALLTGSSSPYSWTQAIPDGNGGFTSGQGSGTANAYEVNGVGGLNGKVVKIRPGKDGDWRFETHCCGGEELCVRVNDGCGGNHISFVCQDCDAWYDPFTFQITDSLGVHMLDPYNGFWLGYQPGYSVSTSVLPFASDNLWSLTPDCDQHRSGGGGYGYYIQCTGSGVALTLRVFAELCVPPGAPSADFAHCVAADAESSWGDASFYWVDFTALASVTCSTFSGTFNFPSTPTAYGSGYGIEGTGDLPFGSVTMPVSSATTVGTPVEAPYVEGATITAVDRDGNVIDTATTDVWGVGCLDLPCGDQYWVSAEKSPPCTGVGCSPKTKQVELNIICPGWICEPTIYCEACDTDIGMTGAMITDAITTVPLTYDAARGLFYSPDIVFNSDLGFSEDYDASVCYVQTGGYYHYEVSCAGSDILVKLFTNPIGTCTFDHSVCGFNMGSSTLVNTWTSSVTPTCDTNVITAVATFDDRTDCTGGVPPPVPSVTATLLVKPQYRVVCCSPCSIPREDLSLSWSGFSSSGSCTMTYYPPADWRCGSYWLTCSGGSMGFSWGGFEEGTFGQLTWYTCEPFHAEFSSGGYKYIIT